MSAIETLELYIFVMKAIVLFIVSGGLLYVVWSVSKPGARAGQLEECNQKTSSAAPGQVENDSNNSPRGARSRNSPGKNNCKGER